jgi:hypothetical protein
MEGAEHGQGASGNKSGNTRGFTVHGRGPTP